jgi:hypothetical protein
LFFEVMENIRDLVHRQPVACLFDRVAVGDAIDGNHGMDDATLGDNPQAYENPY